MLVPDTELADAVRRRFAASGLDAPVVTDPAAGLDGAVLPVRIELGDAAIGPLVVPGEPGCLDCVRIRRAAADPQAAADRAAVLAEHAGPSPWLAAFAGHAIAAVVAAEVHAVRAGRRPRSKQALIMVDLTRLTSRVHPFLPDPLCPTCSSMPDDEPEPVRLRPRRKPDRDASRVARPDPDRVRETYVDPVVGVVTELRETDACGLPVAYAPAGWRDSGKTETGIGRAIDRETSRLAAVLEAVERRAGMAPSGRRPATRASFAQVEAHAVDPRRLGLLPPEAYEGSRYPRFDPDLPLDWVWGHSFGRGEPVLVPRTYAYYGHTLDTRSEPPLVFETSNGCALGSCLEEAALHGLLEVTERDSFLLTWYARMPAPRVELGSARSVDVRLLADRIERASGYRVLAFDTTVEQGIPAVATIALWPGAHVEAVDPSERPAVLCTAAAHLDPERACWAALGELALVVEHLTHAYPQRLADAAAMVADAGLVRAMQDHALLYCHPDTLPRWDFLLGGPGGPAPARTFAESFDSRPEPGDDLLDDLLGLVDRYLRTGLDVIVVDQTGPEQRAAGLVAVKVIVPGTLPITFGHANRRVHGLPRVRTVPVLLGHRTEPLADSDLNPYPHPFP